VNLLLPLDAGSFYRSLPQEFTNTKKYFEELLGRPLIFEETVLLKKAMGITVVIIDDVYNPAEVDEQLKPLKRDYEQARKNADIVIFCPHTGGQFNVTPGKYSEYVLKSAANMGFDVVLSAHSHTTQKAELIGKCRCFFSLGNVTMVPSTFYSVPECLPNYGIAVHLYVEKGEIKKTTFSIFKMVESENKPLQVIPTEDVYNTLTDESEKEKLLEETREIYERVSQKKIPDLGYPLDYGTHNMYNMRYERVSNDIR
jgi:poly-gamma-glutamate synthesis protein (capsule biosynthesis protein)